MNVPDPEFYTSHLATALQLIAKADNYMVGLAHPHDYSHDLYDGAFQILVNLQNSTTESDPDWATLDLALDLCEMYRKQGTEN